MKRGIVFRAFSIVLALTLALQATATGLHAVAASLSQEFQLWLRAGQSITERPTKVFKGSNPKRDPVYRAGRWTPKTLADLARVRLESQLQNMDLWQAATGAFAFQGGMGGGGGGEGGGEGGGSGGGSAICPGLGTIIGGVVGAVVVGAIVYCND